MFNRNLMASLLNEIAIEKAGRQLAEAKYVMLRKKIAEHGVAARCEADKIIRRDHRPSRELHMACGQSAATIAILAQTPLF